MNCPECGRETKVVDSRPMPNGWGVRRRRRCLSCRFRFTTHEKWVPDYTPAKGVSK